MLNSIETVIANANNALVAIAQSSGSSLGELLNTIVQLRGQVETLEQEKQAIQQAFDAKTKECQDLKRVLDAKTVEESTKGDK